MKKVFTISITLLLLIAVFIIGCKKDDDTPKKNNTPNASGYNCVSGNCEEVNSNATYSTLSECQNSCGVGVCGTSFTDPRDEQTYNVVQIGSQCWFAENLRYSGSISEVSGQANWAAIYSNGTEQPAWCYNDNNAANDAIYGKLYNWYAVNTGTLCPQGWHIPTDAEWTVLSDYLGGQHSRWQNEIHHRLERTKHRRYQ